MDHDYQKLIVEALIFSSDVPLSEAKIAAYVDGLTNRKVVQIVEELNQEYSRSQRPFFITRVANGFQHNTHKEFAPWIRKLFKGRAKPRLTQASLETLAIITFKQPVTKTEVDAIRGVNSSGVIKNLLERNLITMTGRAETVGKPLLYATTEDFLKYFGLNNISDLPKPKEIEELIGRSDKDEEISEELIAALTELEAAQQNNSDDETQ